MEAMARADGQRWNRVVRLVVWGLALLPHAVAKGTAMGWGGDAKKVMRKWSFEKLLKTAPDYLHEDDEGEGEEDEGD